MAEESKNLWAPWRQEYLDRLCGEPASDCFLCDYVKSPDEDERHLVLARSSHSLIVMNRFPYAPGHVLVAPLEHLGEFEALGPEALLDVQQQLQRVVRVLRREFHAQGANVGVNLGHCAGAGLPHHIHWHVVPRWSGDTNFMPVISDVRVIPQAMSTAYQMLRNGLA